MYTGFCVESIHLHVKNGTYKNQSESCKIMNARYYGTYPSRHKVFECRLPDIMVLDKKKKDCKINDFVVPGDQNVRRF